MNLHIVRNSVTHDSRVLKETQSLFEADIFDKIEIAGFHEPGYTFDEELAGSTIRRFRLSTRPLPRDIFSQLIKYSEWYMRLVSYYRNKSIRVIHCHDLDPLPIAVTLKKLTGACLIYDAHELETEVNGMNQIRKKLAQRTETKLMRHVDQMIAVSPSIKAWYQNRYPDTPISIVRNIPYGHADHIAAKPLKTELGVPNDALLFIFLGGLTPGRGIERLLDAFCDNRVRHHVLFMGGGPLENIVDEAREKCERIHYRPPVPPSHVLDYAAGADIGLCMYEDTCLNHRYCLPNKLFEALLADLPVFASDLPDQAEIVRTYQAGWVVANEIEQIVSALLNLDRSQVDAVRRGLSDRTRELRWDNEAKQLIAIYKELLKRD